MLPFIFWHWSFKSESFKGKGELPPAGAVFPMWAQEMITEGVNDFGRTSWLNWAFPDLWAALRGNLTIVPFTWLIEFLKAWWQPGSRKKHSKRESPVVQVLLKLQSYCISLTDVSWLQLVTWLSSDSWWEGITQELDTWKGGRGCSLMRAPKLQYTTQFKLSLTSSGPGLKQSFYLLWLLYCIAVYIYEP